MNIYFIKNVLISIYKSIYKKKNNLLMKRRALKFIEEKVQPYSGNNPQGKDIRPLLLNALVLCLVPHTDDEYLGCINTLSDPNISSVCIVYYGYNGKNFKMSKIRPKELENLASRKGFKIFLNEYFAGSDAKKRIDWVSKIVDQLKPTIIFSASYIDWHPDHRSVELDLMSIAKSNEVVDKIIYCYHISVSHSNVFPLYYYGVSKNISKTKLKLFKKYYPSQSNINIYRFALQKYIDARLICQEHHSLETFIHIDSYTKLMNLMIQIDDRLLDNLFLKINDVCQIRESTDALLEKYGFFDSLRSMDIDLHFDSK